MYRQITQEKRFRLQKIHQRIVLPLLTKSYHLQDLENKRKELEEALEAAKNKLKEDQAAIDQDLADLKNKAGNDRAQL